MDRFGTVDPAAVPSAAAPSVDAAKRAQDWATVARLLAAVSDDTDGTYPLSAYQDHARALIHLGRFTQAEAVLVRLCDTWPDQPQGWTGRAEIALKTADWQGAAAAWQDCIRRFPLAAREHWWKNLLTALRKLNRNDEAAKVCQQMRLLWPFRPSGWRVGAELAAARRDWAEAAALSEVCLQRFEDEQTANWWNTYARALTQLGRAAEAEAAHETLRRLWPDRVEGWLGPARAAAAAGNAVLAARTWDTCAARFDLSATATLLGQYISALIRAGRRDQVDRELARLCRRYPDNPLCLSLRIDALEARGEPRQAYTELQAMAQHPGFAAAFPAPHLARLAFEAGCDRDQALIWIASVTDPEAAAAAVEYQYLAPGLRAKTDLGEARDRFVNRLTRNWSVEVRQALRKFLRNRTAQMFERLVTVAVAYCTAEQERRLQAFAARHFPNARARVLLDARQAARHVPASDPDDSFASHWQDFLPQAPYSIRSQIQGRPWRRLVCVLLACNEDEMLPQFLAHYRRLGVESFIIIDNNSTRPPAECLADLQDFQDLEITHVHAPFSFAEARNGMSWINEILEARLCDWLLFADSDELLHYPGQMSHALPKLLDHLDRRGETALAAFMLDVYDRGYVMTGQLSDNPADHDHFCASHDICGDIRPPWRGVINRSRPPGVFSNSPGKVALVKAAAGVRFTGNHTVTSCRLATTTAVFRHLKLFRDREMMRLSAESVLAHPRVRNRATSGIARYIADSQFVVDAAFRHPFHVPFAEDVLLRLGYLVADADWRAGLARTLPADRRAKARALRDRLAGTQARDLAGFPMMDAHLSEVLSVMQRLAAAGCRAEMRVFLNAHLARIGQPDVALALVLVAAQVLGRRAAAGRLLKALTRKIAKLGQTCGVQGLCDCADAMADDPVAARQIIAALAAFHAEDPRVAARQARMHADAGHYHLAIRAVARLDAVAHPEINAPLLRALSHQRDWDGYRRLLGRILCAPEISPSPHLLNWVGICPFPEDRQALWQTLLARMQPEVEGYRGRAMTAYLAVTHLLGQRAASRAAFAAFSDRLSGPDQTFFARLLAKKSDRRPHDHIWGLGLSRTGTASLHGFVRQTGLLSAHGHNPILGTFLTRHEAHLFDCIIDATQVAFARESGVPGDRRIIVTERGFEDWSASFLQHFGRVMALEDPAFGKLRRLINSDAAFSYGAGWKRAQRDLYFRFRTLREAYDFHQDWTGALEQSGAQVLRLPLHLPDAEKARLVAQFLGLPGRAPAYPRANASPMPALPLASAA